MSLVLIANRRDIIQIYAQRKAHPWLSWTTRPKRLEIQREDTIRSGQLETSIFSYWF
jgi:hypothetical protein